MAANSNAGGDSVGPARAWSWAGIGRFASVVAAFGIFGQTVLFLVAAGGLLGEGPTYTQTSAGAARDLADYYVSYFEHQHSILWDIAVRDTLGPIAFLALMVLAVTLVNMVGPRRPEAQLLMLFFVVGGVLVAVTDLIYLALTSYWRHSDWEATPPENMIAVGRSAEAIHEVTTFPQYAGLVVLALGLGCVGRLCRLDDALSSRLGILAYAEAVALVGVAFTAVLRLDTAYNVLGLTSGALLGPAVAIWLGRDIARPRAAAPSTAAHKAIG
ncbi:hypothetical protein [Kribbella sp. NPDC006257]|uniref:hypothetical protein n=1 Tax=Kribbella sp. NPDC006257 TaxID=3156738 RepID=UPI0033AF5BB9